MTLPGAVPPPEFTAEQVCQIVALACRKPEDFDLPLSQWSHADLAATAVEHDLVESISPSHLGRLLREMDVKPHRSKYWLHPEIQDEAEFSRSCTEISTLYLQAPELAAQGTQLVSVDEKTGIQALERKHPDKPTRPGQIERREFEYKRHGTQTLLAGFEVTTGKVVCPSVGPTRTEQDFADLIRNLIDHYAGQTLVIVLDNLNTHKSESLVQLVAQHCAPDLDLGQKDRRGILENLATRAAFLKDPNHRIRFVYTPKHCSWMNQIEIWFGILSRKLLRRGNFSSTTALRDRILAFIDHFNTTLAKPFKWTYAGRPLRA
jgi:transposase